MLITPFASFSVPLLPHSHLHLILMLFAVDVDFIGTKLLEHVINICKKHHQVDRIYPFPNANAKLLFLCNFVDLVHISSRTSQQWCRNCFLQEIRLWNYRNNTKLLYLYLRLSVFVRNSRKIDFALVFALFTFFDAIQTNASTPQIAMCCKRLSQRLPTLKKQRQTERSKHWGKKRKKEKK